MLEFGIMLLLCNSGPYMALLPHGTTGKYPRLHGDHAKASLYGRQAEQVLYHLFIGVPHSTGQLSDYSGRIGSMWEAIAEP